MVADVAHDRLPTFVDLDMFDADRLVGLGAVFLQRPHLRCKRAGQLVQGPLRRVLLGDCLDVVQPLAIRDVTRRGDIVLDGFGGSGTTLIAAERTERVARLIELDPLYCDVICRRFEAQTGQSARLVGTDQTFAEVALERDACTTPMEAAE